MKKLLIILCLLPSLLFAQSNLDTKIRAKDANGKGLTKNDFTDANKTAVEVTLPGKLSTSAVVSATYSKNLLNTADPTIQANKAINTGLDIATFSGFILGPYIPVLPNTVYTWSGVGQSKQLQFATSAKVKSSVQGGVTVTGVGQILTPSDAAYVIFTLKNSSESQPPTMGFYLGTNTTYFPYNATSAIETIGGAPIRATEVKVGATIDGGAGIVAGITATKSGENLYNPQDVTGINGQFVGTGGYDLGSNGSFTLSPYIAVTGGGVYTLSNLGIIANKNIQFSDAAKTKLASPNSGSAITSDPFAFTVPAAASYILFNARAIGESAIPGSLKLQTGSTATAYNAYQKPSVSELNGLKLQAGSLAPNTLTSDGKTIATTDQITGAKPSFPANFSVIVASGTSITNDFGSSTIANGYRNIASVAITGILGRSVTVVNGGISGQTSAGMLSNLNALLTTYQPQIVFVEVPVNDSKYDGNGLTRAQSESNLTAIVQQVKAFGAVPIMWTSLTVNLSVNSNGSSFSRQKQLELNAIGRKVAKTQGVRLVDIGQFSGQNFLLFSDGLHPNDQGHSFIAEQLTSEVVTP